MAQLINLISLCYKPEKLEKDFTKIIKLIKIFKEKKYFTHIQFIYKIQLDPKLGSHVFTKSFFNNKVYNYSIELAKLENSLQSCLDLYQYHLELNEVISSLEAIHFGNYSPLKKEKYEENIERIFFYFQEMIYLADVLYESRDYETLSDFIPKEIEKKYIDFIRKTPTETLKKLIVPLKYLNDFNKPHFLFFKNLNYLKTLNEELFQSIKYLSNDHLFKRELILDDFHIKDGASESNLKTTFTYPGIYICLDFLKNENFEKVIYSIKNRSQKEECITNDNLKCIYINKLKNMEMPKSILKSKGENLDSKNKKVHFDKNKIFEYYEFNNDQDFKSEKKSAFSLNNLDCFAKKKKHKKNFPLIETYKAIEENSMLTNKEDFIKKTADQEVKKVCKKAQKILAEKKF